MVPDQTKVYHGSTLTAWQENRPGKASLYVTIERREAENYATEQAGREDSTDAIVCISTVQALRALGLVFEADDGCHFLPANATWQQSIAACGCFRLDGFSDAIKPAFTIEQPLLRA